MPDARNKVVDGFEYSCSACGSKEATGSCSNRGGKHDECEFPCASCGEMNVGGRCIGEGLQVVIGMTAGPAIAFCGGSISVIDMMRERGLMGLVGEIILGWAQAEYNLWILLPDKNRPGETTPFKGKKARWSDDIETWQKYRSEIDPSLHPHIERLRALDKKYRNQRNAIAHGALMSSSVMEIRNWYGGGHPDISLPANLYLVLGDDEEKVKVRLDVETLKPIADGTREMLDVLDKMQSIAAKLALRTQSGRDALDRLSKDGRAANLIGDAGWSG